MSITLTIHDQSYILKPGETTIGRDTSCDIIIQDPSVSRRHAKIVCGDFDGVLVELGSYHGTRVNGKTVKGKANIYEGDLISIGSVKMQVDSGPVRPVDEITDRPQGQEEVSEKKGFKFAFNKSDLEKAEAQNRFKNPFYITLMVVLAVLVLATVILLAMPGPKKKKRKILSQSDVVRLTQKYLDSSPVVTIEGLSEEQIAEAAKKLFLNAEQKREFIEIRPGQAFDSYRRYQKSLALLNALGHKPDYYDRLMLNMNKCRRVVIEKIHRYSQEGWVSRKKGEWDQAHKAYQMVLSTVPTEDFPVANNAKREIRYITAKLVQKGKKK